MKILYAEDQDDQVLLVEAALQIAGVTVELAHVGGGGDCLAYMRRGEPFSAATPPDLVLLDLSMPRVTGFDVLAARAADPLLRRIPVVVLTSSNNPADVRKAYELGANSYVTKPLDLHRLAAVLKEVVGYWSGPVSLPTPGAR